MYRNLSSILHNKKEEQRFQHQRVAIGSSSTYRRISVHVPKWADIRVQHNAAVLQQKQGPQLFKHVTVSPSTIAEVSKRRYQHALSLYRAAYEKPLVEKYSEYYAEMQQELQEAKKAINMGFRNKRKAAQVKKRIEILRRQIQKKMIIAMDQDVKGYAWGITDNSLLQMGDGLSTLSELNEQQVSYLMAQQEQMEEQQEEEEGIADLMEASADLIREDQLDLAQEKLRREAQQVFTTFIRNKLKSLGLPEDTLGPLPDVPPLDLNLETISPKPNEELEDWAARVLEQYRKEVEFEKQLDHDYLLYGPKPDADLWKVRGVAPSPEMDPNEPPDPAADEEIKDTLEKHEALLMASEDPFEHIVYELEDEELAEDAKLDALEAAKINTTKGNAEEEEEEDEEDDDEDEEDDEYDYDDDVVEFNLENLHEAGESEQLTEGAKDWELKLKEMEDKDYMSPEELQKFSSVPDLINLMERELNDANQKRDSLSDLDKQHLDTITKLFAEAKKEHEESQKPYDPADTHKRYRETMARTLQFIKRTKEAEQAKLPPKPKKLRQKKPKAKRQLSEEERGLKGLETKAHRIDPYMNAFEIQIPYYTALKMKKEIAEKTLRHYKLLTGRVIPLEEVFAYEGFPDDPKEHLKRVADSERETETSATSSSLLDEAQPSKEIEEFFANELNEEKDDVKPPKNIQVVEITDEDIIKEGLDPEEFKLYKQELYVVPDDMDVIDAIDEYL